MDKKLLPYIFSQDEDGYAFAKVPRCPQPSYYLIPAMKKGRSLRIAVNTWHPDVKRCFLEIYPKKLHHHEKEFSIKGYKLYKLGKENTDKDQEELDTIFQLEIEIKDLGPAILIASSKYSNAEIMVCPNTVGFDIIANSCREGGES